MSWYNPLSWGKSKDLAPPKPEREILSETEKDQIINAADNRRTRDKKIRGLQMEIAHILKYKETLAKDPERIARINAQDPNKLKNLNDQLLRDQKMLELLESLGE